MYHRRQSSSILISHSLIGRRYGPRSYCSRTFRPDVLERLHAFGFGTRTAKRPRVCAKIGLDIRSVSDGVQFQGSASRALERSHRGALDIKIT